MSGFIIFPFFVKFETYSIARITNFILSIVPLKTLFDYEIIFQKNVFRFASLISIAKYALWHIYQKTVEINLHYAEYFMKKEIKIYEFHWQKSVRNYFTICESYRTSCIQL